MGLPGRIAAVALLAVLLGAVSADGARAEERALLVFAAASLKNALDAAAADFSKDANAPVTISYAASPTLAKQIEAGAPADIFISADLDWMDYLDERGLIKADTRRNLVGNTLVLIAPAEAPVELAIGPGFPIAEKLGDGRLAMANTQAVPAGRYGKAALATLGVWPEVEGRLAEADNVRAALSLVSRGEAPLGIVYASDAAADPRVAIVDAFPAVTHPQIVYPIAVTATSTHPAAQDFVSFLAGDAGRGHFEKEGFSILTGDASN
jgi:molybdate transport system substrate-binding protein